MQDIGVVKNGAGFDVYAGGRSSGLTPRPGVLILQGLPEADMPAAVRRIIEFYQTDGQGRERFWKFVDRVGAERLVNAADPHQIRSRPEAPGPRSA